MPTRYWIVTWLNGSTDIHYDDSCIEKLKKDDRVVSITCKYITEKGWEVEKVK